MSGLALGEAPWPPVHRSLSEQRGGEWMRPSIAERALKPVRSLGIDKALGEDADQAHARRA
jgi:hypothetical protein